MRTPVPGLIAIALVATTLGAQQVLTLDLSIAAQHDTVSVVPGRYQVAVASLAPKYSYVIAVSRGQESITPIVSPFGVSGTPCQAVTDALKALKAATAEVDVPKLIKDVNSALEKEGSIAGCVDASTAKNVRDGTRRVFDDVYSLEPGEYIVVNVARIEGDKPTKRWQRRFTTGPAGAWRVTYGYVFPFLTRIAGPTRLVWEGQRYFAKQIGDTGSRFVVTPEQRTRPVDAVPAVVFGYVPAAEGEWTWSRIVAGLGTDLAKSSLFLGSGLTYRSNLTVTAGVAFRQEPTLLGRYAVGDTVTTNLTPDQLQEDVFRVRPFIGVTLRFDKNPFSQGSGSASGGEKPAEAKAATGSLNTSARTYAVDPSVSASAGRRCRSPLKGAVAGRPSVRSACSVAELR